MDREKPFGKAAGKKRNIENTGNSSKYMESRCFLTFLLLRISVPCLNHSLEKAVTYRSKILAISENYYIA